MEAGQNHWALRPNKVVFHNRQGKLKRFGLRWDNTASKDNQFCAFE